jgi:iron(III) transport system substrate-binding protein
MLGYRNTTIASFAIAIGTVTFALPTPTMAQTAAEKLFASFSKISLEERTAKLAAGAKKGGKLNMIQTIRGKLGNSHLAIFRKRYPFIKFSTFELGTMDASSRLVSEEAAGRHLTDAVQITLPDLPQILDKKLAAVNPSPAVKRILPIYRSLLLDPQHRWIPWQIEEHGISYNPKLMKHADAPKSYEALCNPKYKGISSYEPSETKFVIGLYYINDKDMAKTKKLIECIGKNDPIIQRGHTVRLQLMMAGDHSLMGDNFLYKGTLKNKKNPKKAPFKVVYEAPVMIFGGVIVINPNTPNPHAAALFADWTLSNESQAFFKKEFRGPVALSHPYFPDDAQLVSGGVTDAKIVNELLDHWVKSIGKR